VDLGTGLFVYRAVDLYEPDVMPIVLTRIYRQGDSASRDFGIGTQNSYNLYMVGNFNTLGYVDLVLADGSQINFNATIPGIFVFQNLSSPGPFYGATVSQTPQGWTLRQGDGTARPVSRLAFALAPESSFGRRFAKTINGTTTDFLYDGSNPVQGDMVRATVCVRLQRYSSSFTFPCISGPSNYQQDGVYSIADRRGNTLSISRGGPGYAISQITSPNGRWVQFTYDASNRDHRQNLQRSRPILRRDGSARPRYRRSHHHWLCCHLHRTFAQYTYEPFGKPTLVGSSTNPYQYTGRENDGASVYFYRARYYDPTIGRFISEDPIRF
jgi:hypothetical protein